MTTTEHSRIVQQSNSTLLAGSEPDSVNSPEQAKRQGHSAYSLRLYMGAGAFDTFDKVEADFKGVQFLRDGTVPLSGFSQAICNNTRAYGEKECELVQRTTMTPSIGSKQCLAGYKQIVVQSLQVIPGEEYRHVRDIYVKDFMNNRDSDFTNAYMKSLRPSTGCWCTP